MERRAWGESFFDPQLQPLLRCQKCYSSALPLDPVYCETCSANYCSQECLQTHESHRYLCLPQDISRCVNYELCTKAEYFFQMVNSINDANMDALFDNWRANGIEIDEGFVPFLAQDLVTSTACNASRLLFWSLSLCFKPVCYIVKLSFWF